MGPLTAIWKRAHQAVRDSPEARIRLDKLQLSVEFRPLAQLLEDLLLGAGDVDAEIHLAQAAESEIADFQGLKEEYEQRYARAVSGVCEMRGAPTFAGSPGSPGFPNGLRGEHASCWIGPDGMIYLALSVGPAG